MRPKPLIAPISLRKGRIDEEDVPFARIASHDGRINSNDNIARLVLVQTGNDERQISGLLTVVPLDDTVTQYLREPKSKARQNARDSEESKLWSLLEGDNAMSAHVTNVSFVQHDGPLPEYGLMKASRKGERLGDALNAAGY